MKRKYWLWILLLVLAAASLACNLGRKGVKTPEPTIPVSTEAVQGLEATVQNTYNEMQQTGAINLTITEEQLTSLLAFELVDTAGSAISNPQVRLRDGQVEITADLKSDDFSAQAKVVADVNIDSGGKPSLDVVSANIGPIPLPEQLVKEVENQLNQAFIGQIAMMAPNLFIESIVIENGTMTITGHTQ